MSSNPPPTRTIAYHRSTCAVSLAPEDLQRLGGDITVPKREAVADQTHGYDVREVQESLLTSGRMPNAGLIDVLSLRALKRGYRLAEICESSISTLPEPADVDQVDYPAWVRFVHREHRGLVKVPGQFDIAVLIANLVVAYPTARIMFLGRINNLKPVYARLLRLVPQETRREKQLAFVRNGRTLRLTEENDVPRVIFCTPMAAADLDSEKCDIVVIDDAFECMHETMQWPLVQVDGKFRLFGILRRDRKPKPYEKARIHQVFGFRQLDLMDGGRVRRPVHFAWIRHAGQAPAGSVITTPAIGNRRSIESVDPQEAYVHNHKRNEQISRLAKKLRTGAPLRESRFKDIRRWLNGRESQQRGVTVVVEHLDHAIQLARKLDNWPIIAAAKNNLHNLSKSTKRRIIARPQQWLPCQIVVADEGWTCGGFHSDVVIWAAGGVAITLPEFWTFTRNSADRPLLVIDFLDDFTEATRKWSYQRRHDLIRRDVFRVGTSAVIGRIHQFENSAGGTR